MGNPAADSAVNENCLEHTCAYLHAKSQIASPEISPSILSIRTLHSLAITRNQSDLVMQVRLHPFLGVSSLASDPQEERWPPASHLAFKNRPCTTATDSLGDRVGTHTHTHRSLSLTQSHSPANKGEERKL